MKTLLLLALLALAPAALAAPSFVPAADVDALIPCATPVDCAVLAFLCQLHPLHLCLG